MSLPVFYLILTSLKPNLMKKTLIVTLFIALIFGSCAHGITVYEAANGKAKCRKTYIK